MYILHWTSVTCVPCKGQQLYYVDINMIIEYMHSVIMYSETCEDTLNSTISEEIGNKGKHEKYQTEKYKMTRCECDNSCRIESQKL